MSIPMISNDNSTKKFAVVIGINYNTVPSSRLNGCINDATNIRNFLINKCGYLASNVYMMADNGRNVNPTMKNILNAMDFLVRKATMEGFTELWFSYSGHGSYLRDTNNEEKDGKDETICPVDYPRTGFLIDDIIYSNLISKLPSNVRLTALFDSCHSGTILDLPTLYDANKNVVVNNSNMTRGNVVCISGCTDSQTSADALIQGKYTGAMTWSFLKVMENMKYVVKCKDLVDNMRILLSQNGYSQVPLLATSSLTLLDSYLKK